MLKVQSFLRGGGTIEDLETKYAITAKRHGEYPQLVLLKYSQIDSPFAEQIVRECRGIILDESNDWKVVCASPFKFFNAEEFYASPIDWKTSRVFEKYDGSLCQLYAYDGRWLFSTSGSPDGSGPVADYGMRFHELFWANFKHKLPPVDCGVSFFFELCSIYNKIVVVHKEPRIILLGARNLETMRELSLEEAHKFFPECEAARTFPLTSLDKIKKSYETFSGLEMEGYVVCDAQFNRIKCKSAQYVSLHHLKDSLGSSRRAMVEIVRTGEVDEIAANMPEYKDILFEAKSKFDTLVSELEDVYKANSSIENQKEFALSIKGCRCSSALFSLRAKKTTSIRRFLSDMNIDSVMNLLGYKTSNEKD